MISSQNSFNEYEWYITPSDIIEFNYCKRFIYFMRCLRIEQYEGRRYKVEKGRNIHEQRKRHNRSYLRKKIGSISKYTDVNLVSKEMKIRGIVDEVHELEDGTMAPLDYKFATYNDVIYLTYKTQLIMYALMIEEIFGKIVNEGYIVYCRGGNRLVKVDINPTDKIKTLKIIEEYKNVVNGYFPKRTRYLSRCTDCCYKNICIK